MNTASRGFSRPTAARPIPRPSTAIVPAKFTMMMRRHRRASASVFTTVMRSLPMSITSALSRATSVPDAMAMPTLACMGAGVSLIPSPTTATVLPSTKSDLKRSTLSFGRSSA
jgi:hypothetical protein